MSVRDTAAAPQLEGALGDLALADVLQLLELGRRTGVLHVRDVGGQLAGRVDVHEGRVVGAAAAPEAAVAEDAPLERAEAAVVDAVCALVGVQAGRFAFVPAPVVGGGGGVRIERLLVEAMRRADEWARLADVLPGPTAVATLATRPDGGVVALAAREWALLAELDGVRDVDALAGALGRPTLSVAADLAALLRAGVAEVVARAAASYPALGGVPDRAGRSSFG